MKSFLSAHKRVCLDTMSIIYLVEDHPRFGRMMESIARGVDAGEKEAFSSSLALAETLVKPLKEGRPDLAKRYKDLLTGTPGFHLVSMDEDVAGEAARIRAQYGYRLPDAIHLATALLGEAEAFVTNDDGLRKFMELPVVILADQ